VPAEGNARKDGVSFKMTSTLIETTVSAKAKKLWRQPEAMVAAYGWLLLFIVVYCARPEDWIPGLHIIPLGKVTAIGALLAFLFSIGSRPPGIGFPPEGLYLILLFCQMGVASVFSPVWRGGAVENTIEFGKIVLMVLVMTFAVTTLPRLRKLLFVQVSSVAAVTFVSIFREHVDKFGRLQGVLNGPYQNSNDLALTITLALPFCLVFLLRTRSFWRRLAWALTTAMMAFALVRTGSRGGLIAMLVVGAVCLWEFGVKGRRFFLIFFAMLVGVGILVLGGKVVRERFEVMFNPNANFRGAEAAYASAQGREEVLWKSLVVTAQHPLFGVGPGDFQVLSGSWHSSHDVYTQLSSEAGLPALILFLLIFQRAFSAVRKVRRDKIGTPELLMFAAATRADLFAFAIASFFSPVAYQFFSYFLMAYATATYRIAVLGTQRDLSRLTVPVRLGARDSKETLKPRPMWTT
jgi:O-antigen ligase